MTAETLIARLESATEGSRPFSYAVLRACGWKADGPMLITPDGRRIYHGDAPNVSVSLDDALRLVPEGWWWRVAGVPFMGVEIAGTATFPPCQAEIGTDWHLHPAASCHAATPALALCAAILRAHGG